MRMQKCQEMRNENAECRNNPPPCPPHKCGGSNDDISEWCQALVQVTKLLNEFS